MFIELMLDKVEEQLKKRQSQLDKNITFKEDEIERLQSEIKSDFKELSRNRKILNILEEVSENEG